MVHPAAGGVTGFNDGKKSQPVSLGGQNDFRGAARREAILDVIGMEVNPKVVKGFGIGKILQLLRKVVRESLEILGKMWRDSEAAALVKKARSSEERARG
jgi:hypothetical protein